jgi:crotonobetainyl-CoA:carnitine CoA-transferase CaiB-like acyl-CoA transferase
MGALFHRERTGEATVVDVSLLGTGLWAMGQAMAMSLIANVGWQPPPQADMLRNPLVGNYLTKDGRYVSLCCLQAGQYWPAMCEVLGRPELATDDRFKDH